MAETILFFAVAGLGLWLFLIRGEVAFLRRRVSDLEDSLPLRAAAEPTPEPIVAEPVAPFKVAAKATTRRVAAVVSRDVVPAPDWEATEEEAPKPAFKNPFE